MHKYIAFLAKVRYTVNERSVMGVENKLQGEQFCVRYVESEIESAVLWESHCHAQYEMIAVLKGEICVLVQGRSYRLTEHKAVILPPLLYHTITADKKGIYRRVTALFDLAAVPEVLHGHFAEKGAVLTVLDAPEGAELMRICESGERALYLPLAQSLLTQLFYRDFSVKGAITGGEIDEFLHKILAYIDAHLCEPVSLSDLAALCARSKSSACHLFEQKMGVSPGQYILQKKLALASKLIRDGVPPTEVAARVGYDNYGNFYRVYKKHLGTAPSHHKR